MQELLLIITEFEFSDVDEQASIDHGNQCDGSLLGKRELQQEIDRCVCVVGTISGKQYLHPSIPCRVASCIVRYPP